MSGGMKSNHDGLDYARNLVRERYKAMHESMGTDRPWRDPGFSTREVAWMIDLIDRLTRERDQYLKALETVDMITPRVIVMEKP